MLENVPTLLELGVPLSTPLTVLKAAHDGLFAMLYVRVLPSGSEAVGANKYAWPATTDVLGVPEIVGGELPATTVIENAGSETVAAPSLTRMTMFANVPTLPEAGVPC